MMSEPEFFAGYRWPERQERFVRANMVTSLDGARSLSGASGTMSNETDFKLLHHLRAGADVVVVGARTAIDERYIGIPVSAETMQWRRSMGKAAHPPLAVLSRKGDVPDDAPFFERTVVPTLVVVTAATDDELRASVQRAQRIGSDKCRIVDARSPAGSVVTVLDRLADMGLRHVLCEGGPRVINELAQQSLIDELCLTIAPHFVGGDGSNLPPITNADSFEATFAATVSGLVFTRWRRRPGSRTQLAPVFRTYASIATAQR